MSMKKCLALCVVIILVTSVFGTAIGTGVDVEDESFSSGSFAGEDAIEIHDWYDLDEVRNNLSGDYVLMNDLDEETDGYDELVDTGDGWEPIGGEDNPFKGNFDGQNHQIRSLFIDRPDETYVGLFGMTEGDSLFKNIEMVDVNITAGNEVGSLAAVMEGEIIDSHVSGQVTGDDQAVGGLVGVIEGNLSSSSSSVDVQGGKEPGGLAGAVLGEVSDSYATGDVEGYWPGGLAGAVLGDVSDSYATGNVTGYKYVGGLVGSMWGNITNSHATGDLGRLDYEGNYMGGLVGSLKGNATESYATGDIKGRREAGGLIGSCTGSISNSYAKGDVEGYKNVGGLIGEIAGDIENSHSSGNVTGTSNYVGGLVGSTYGNISDSHAEGDVHGSSNIGGLIGGMGGNVEQTYATGDVRGNRRTGGLIGWSKGEVENSHSAGNVTGDSYYVGGLVGDSEGNISNSHTTGDVTGFNREVGGLAGRLEGYVKNSYTTGEVWGEHQTGGVVGRNYGLIEWSFFKGEVQGRSSLGGVVGDNKGVIGRSFSEGNIRGYSGLGGIVGVNDGEVQNSYSNVREVSGETRIGGAIGINSGSVKNSYSVGEINDVETKLGGIEIHPIMIDGYNSTIVVCDDIRENGTAYYRGSERPTQDGDGTLPPEEDYDEHFVVSVYNQNDEPMEEVKIRAQGAEVDSQDETNSTGHAKLSLDGCKLHSHEYASLIEIETITENITLINPFGVQRDEIPSSNMNKEMFDNKEYMKTNSPIGGLIGEDDEGKVEDSFWDIETTGQQHSAGGTGKTTAEMKDVATYTDTETEGLEEPWDFVDDPYDDGGDKDIWDIDEETNDGYPYLTWEDEEEIPDEYELTVHIEGEGTVEVDGQEVYDGWIGEFGDEEVELVADADDGWAFDGWTGDYEGHESVVEITMEEDKEITAHFTDVDEIPDLFLEEYSFTNSAPSTLHRILEFIDLYDLQLSGEFEAEFSDPDMIDSAELELELEYFKPIEGGWESPRETYHETQYFNLEKEGDEWLCEIEVGSWYPGGPLALLVSILTKEHWVPGWVIPVIGIEQVYTGAEITEIEVNTIDGQKEVMEVEESIKTSHEKAWEAYKEDNNEIVMMGSPATVMIESEEGRLGSDGDETYEEIDGYYSGMDSEVQLIGLPTPGKDYDVSIYGTEDGEYNLNVGSIREGDYEEIIMEENEEISEGEEKNWEINTPDDLEDEDEVDWLPYMGIGIIALIVLVIAVILINKRGKSESSREEEYYQRQSTSRNQSSRVPQQPKGPPAQETSEQSLCPHCGNRMRYIEEYESWYCDSCQEYK